MGTPIEGGEVQGEVSAETNAPGPNPAWNDVLSVLPEQFHSVVTPHFQQWDQAAQQRIEQANSSVKQFEDFQPFVENGVSAQDLEQGYRLLHEINQNPQAVYEALAEAYNLGGEQIEAEEEEGEEDEAPEFQDPRFDQLQQGVELVAQTLLNQQQEKLNQQAERDLDNSLNALRKEHGDFDERYVLSLAAANDIPVEEAHKSYQELVQNILQKNPRPFAPNVMGNSGGHLLGCLFGAVRQVGCSGFVNQHIDTLSKLDEIFRKPRIPG